MLQRLLFAAALVASAPAIRAGDGTAPIAPAEAAARADAETASPAVTDAEAVPDTEAKAVPDTEADAATMAVDAAQDSESSTESRATVPGTEATVQATVPGTEATVQVDAAPSVPEAKQEVPDPATAAATPISTATATAAPIPTATPAATPLPEAAAAAPSPETAAAPAVPAAAALPNADVPAAAAPPAPAPEASATLAPADATRAGPLFPAVAAIAAEPPPRVLARRRNAAGETVIRVVDSRGHLLELALDRRGGVARTRDAGTVIGLLTVSEQRNARGGWVRTARDHSGAMVRYAVDADGEAYDVEVIAQAPAARRAVR